MPNTKLLLRLGQKALFNPMNLGPNVLIAWWNPDLHANTAYMTDDGSGLISSFSSMGSARIAATATTTARPTWTSTAWTPNSKAGLTYDGTATTLAATGVTALPNGATAGEMWALFSDATPTSTNFHAIAVYGTASGAAARRIGNTNTNPNRLWVSDFVTSLIDTAAPAFSGAGHIVGANWSGTTEGGRTDGVITTPATATIGSLNTGTTRLRIGAGNDTSANLFWNGVIRHLIITTLLTVAQRQLMEGWLAWDGWSSAAANPLPVDHPYKYRAP